MTFLEWFFGARFLSRYAALMRTLDDDFTNVWHEIQADAVDNILDSTILHPKPRKSGFYWWVHHGKIVEYCYDYDERVDYIKEFKPKSEIAVRLKHFQPVKNPGMLPDITSFSSWRWQTRVFKQRQQLFKQFQLEYPKCKSCNCDHLVFDEEDKDAKR